MSTPYIRTLFIAFNEFRSTAPITYTERVTDSSDEIIREHEFARRPRAARYDYVFENGSGSHNQWNAHRAKRLYGHHLLKPSAR